MDEVEWLIQTFQARSASSVRAKTDILLDLERLRDPRVVPFLLGVLLDEREAIPVRVHALKRLRNGTLTAVDRPAIAEAIVRILSEDSSADLRMHGVLALGEFSDIHGVAAALGGLALDADEQLDVRFSAFTSLQRAGATTECVAVLRLLLTDEAFGPSARHVLSLWRVPSCLNSP
jgi:hypothetical protein